MLKFRIIARMDIRNEHLIKTIRLEGTRKVGDPYEFAKEYNDGGIDEVIYLDTVASLYGRNALGPLVEHSTEAVFCPVIAAGGIRSVEDARCILQAGADGVAVNTAAIKRPELITELSQKIGSQSVTLQLDAKRKGSGYEAYCDGGRQPTGRDAIAWAREVVGLGCGQIFCTFIDVEGTSNGPGLELLDRLISAVSVPVIYSGGIGAAEDVVAVAETGASAVAIAGALHYKRETILSIKEALDRAGIPVRLEEWANAS
jgi:cyclase